MKENSRLLFYVLFVLLVPALLSQMVRTKEGFNPRPIAQLRAEKPQVVLMSDSTLYNGVDPQLMETLLGRRVALSWYGGAASASWYFRLKNYVVASGVRPELVCILFRDRMLTDPEFRSGGIFRRNIELTMHEDEPVYREVLENKAVMKSKMERYLSLLYPANRRRAADHEKIARIVNRVVGSIGLGMPDLPARTNEVFTAANLRSGASEAAAVTSAPEAEFDADPEHSFLPHMVDLAEQAGIKLCFLRVKRYPGRDGRVPQTESLRRYISQLKAWVESRGCIFIDDIDNPERTQQMFAAPGDDHTAASATRRSTELYAEELRPLLLP